MNRPERRSPIRRVGVRPQDRAGSETGAPTARFMGREWVLKEQIAAWLWDAAFPLILAFSLGEEGVLRPAWNSKAALTHPAAGFLAQQGACLPRPEGGPG
jgi:hypothetical protein